MYNFLIGNHFVLEKAFDDHESLFKLAALNDFLEITLKKRSLYKDLNECFLEFARFPYVFFPFCLSSPFHLPFARKLPGLISRGRS